MEHLVGCRGGGGVRVVESEGGIQGSVVIEQLAQILLHVPCLAFAFPCRRRVQSRKVCGH